VPIVHRGGVCVGGVLSVLSKPCLEAVVHIVPPFFPNSWLTEGGRGTILLGVLDQDREASREEL
jgi:hypothetical protein